MKLNITKPLQLAQWLSYLILLFLISVIIILPLSVILFNDFYLSLLPKDSSQWLPLANFNFSINPNNILSFETDIQRLNPDINLPPVINNGLISNIYLRESIIYKFDAIFNFYCLKNNSNLNNHQLTNLNVKFFSVYGKNNDMLIYNKDFPITCMKTNIKFNNYDQIDILSNNQHNHASKEMNILNQINKYWLNKIDIDDILSIGTNSDHFTVEFNLPIGDELIFNFDTSFIRSRMVFDQDFRNIMLRWSKTTYIIGTIIFFILICFIFLITFSITFFFILKNNKNTTIKN
ncbi:hypothetical protein TBLA_0I03050 [Henningerozyma blattae CBS 6284]|uniref:Seipin n=1 Tax=Henningerozyma blattae (strain ATCC 34711 / CBS 6284 / DSM 70876 / NBRC 10599 / NRRL Y-10934 / UCD 77-7) TaxID=1071380 RepID=I2H9A9_HENB6|nr:hypothetical protein TBLA_0I03050 [Tetrapisispora blattae CBS 6284]CCH62961.1 hypothetical protein TBLA_0I03050 [Tetrapisispora blattae CBS 6284]